MVYCVDEDDHTVRKFTRSGRLVDVIGSSGQPSDTGADWSIPDFKARIASIARGAAPFNHPTKLAVAPKGDLYVSDGYANARIHHFSGTGELLMSWGEPGTGPGQFHVPHSLVVSQDEELLVADRENDRIQVFSLDGKFVEEWTDVRRPSAIAIDSAGFVYVSEMASPIGHQSWVHGSVEKAFPARVSVFDAQARLEGRFAHGDHPCDSGNLLAPHGLAIDSSGSLYVAEITLTSLVSGSGGVSRSELGERHCHIVHKFTPVGSEHT
jgi:DNA-binding beta-propeller fold protein YncE